MSWADQSIECIAEKQTQPVEKPIIVSLADATQDIKPTVVDAFKSAGNPFQATLRGLPTPSRGKNGPAKKATESQAAPAPAPWELNKQAATEQNGYRELLQMRGQQAMQRSRLSNIVPVPPPPSPIAELSYAASVQAPAQMPWVPPMPGQSAWFVETPMQAQPLPQFSTMPVPSAVEQLCGPNVEASLRLPAEAMVRVPTSSQDALATAAPSPTNGIACESPCTPQELMTMMGGGAFGCDEHQIAEALRAAAPCVYDD